MILGKSITEAIVTAGKQASGAIPTPPPPPPPPATPASTPEAQQAAVLRALEQAAAMVAAQRATQRKRLWILLGVLGAGTAGVVGYRLYTRR